MYAKNSIFFIFLCASVIFSEEDNKINAYQYFMQAEYELLNNNFDQAEYYYHKTLSITPHSLTVLQSMVDLKTFEGEYSDAIKYLKQITSLYPNNLEYGLKFYELLSDQENLVKAERALDTLSFYHPNDLEILYSRVEINFKNQNWIALINAYYSIYLLIPENIDILSKMFEIGINTGNVNIVSEIFWEIKNTSTNDRIIKLLIEIEKYNGNYNKSIELTKELIEIISGAEAL